MLFATTKKAGTVFYVVSVHVLPMSIHSSYFGTYVKQAASITFVPYVYHTVGLVLPFHPTAEVSRLQLCSFIDNVARSRSTMGEFCDLLQGWLLAEVGKIKDVQILGHGFY